MSGIKHEISLSADQVKLVRAAGAQLPPDKRDVFLQRIVRALRRNGWRFNDSTLAQVIQEALTGLIQQPAA